LLKGAASRFKYLQQGIAVVLAFVGIKMLIEYFGIRFSVFISLMVILVSISGSIAISLYRSRNKINS
jgi:tellurite resistance protein TerC